jgi:hypothetical protein
MMDIFTNGLDSSNNTVLFCEPVSDSSIISMGGDQYMMKDNTIMKIPLPIDEGGIMQCRACLLLTKIMIMLKIIFVSLIYRHKIHVAP